MSEQGIGKSTDWLSRLDLTKLNYRRDIEYKRKRGFGNCETNDVKSERHFQGEKTKQIRLRYTYDIPFKFYLFKIN